GPEVRVQRQLRGRRAVLTRELGREVEEVEQRRAPPRVDVLVGIADRRDREALAEQALDEPPLRDVRVLVLVEDDGREARTEVLRHLRVFLRDAKRQRDLIREVDDSALTLQLLEHL